jgi:hypothetical protein
MCEEGRVEEGKMAFGGANEAASPFPPRLRRAPRPERAAARSGRQTTTTRPTVTPPAQLQAQAGPSSDDRRLVRCNPMEDSLASHRR